MKQLDLRIANKYRLIERLGGGGFGEVYLAADVDSGEEVAVKLEHHSIGRSFLRDEAEIYQSLAGGQGIPRVFWSGPECEYQALVFELLGPSLEDLFNYCDRRFSLKTTLMLADQLICRLRYIHSRNFVHRDVKPANCLMGSGRSGNTVYMTDLGLTTEHLPNRAPPEQFSPENHGHLLGTARFASRNAHRAIELSRRDDMESLGYMLIYFAQGRLPWQGLKAGTEQERLEKIFKAKYTITSKELIGDLPAEFQEYLDHVRNLDFGEIPKYDHLRRSFRRLFRRHGFEYDHVFDWTERKFKEQT